MKTSKEANIATLGYLNGDVNEAMKVAEEMIDLRIAKKKFFATIRGIMISRNYVEVINNLTKIGYVCEPHMKNNVWCEYIKVSWKNV